MTLSFLRPAIVAALAVASLASCGGKATFDINVTVEGLAYPGLMLTETKSGQTITVTDIKKNTFSFPNTIEYGTEFNVVIPKDGQPLHQTCSPFSGTSGSAGQMASINVVFTCSLNPHTVGGNVRLAPEFTGDYTGLQLINGSNDRAQIALDPKTGAYAYPNITFGTPYGITIFAQPKDTNVVCDLVPEVPHPGATSDKVAGIMGDADVRIDVVCKKKL